MRHLLIALGLALASLLLVQLVVSALEVSAQRPHDDSDFVPGTLPKSAIGMVPIGTARRVTEPERARPQPRPSEGRSPSEKQPAPRQPIQGTPPSLRLPSPPSGVAPRPFDDRV